MANNSEGRHFFAMISDTWNNLPDERLLRWQSPDDLRKHALIMTGHNSGKTWHCATTAEANRLAGALRSTAESYVEVEVDGTTVIRRIALSQGADTMTPAELARSRKAVLDYLATLRDQLGE
jgi:hypothetical protein